MSIETFEHNGKTIEIDYEDEPSSPRDWSNLGIMLANGHRRYNLGDYAQKLDEYDEAERALTHYAERGKIRLFPRWCQIYLGSTVVLPLGLIDHSGISMYVGGGAHPQDPGGWDSGLVGFIFDTAKRREEYGTDPKDVEEVLCAEVETYDEYLTGQVFSYTIEDEEGNVVDSCGDIYGLEYAMQSARDAAGYTCTHCGYEIARNIGPIVDPREDAERDGIDWTHDLCKTCNGPTAWGKEGEYHLEFDITMSQPHTADGVRRRACPSGDTVAEPAQYVGSYQ